MPHRPILPKPQCVNEKRKAFMLVDYVRSGVVRPGPCIWQRGGLGMVSPLEIPKSGILGFGHYQNREHSFLVIAAQARFCYNGRQ